MLTIQFPGNIKTYPVSKDYNHTINVRYESREQELYIDAQFDGYSYYLERGIISAGSEMELIGRTLKFKSIDGNSPGHELASHHDEDPDLIILNSVCTFSGSEQGFIKVTVEGTAAVLDNESDDNPPADGDSIPFTLTVDAAIAVEDWELELAFGLDYAPQEKIEDMNELMTVISGRLREMTDDNDTEATELVKAYSSRDERSLNCYGKNDRLIIEGYFPVESKFSNYVLAHKDGKNKSAVPFKPDSVNPEMEVMEDEFFTVQEAENIFRMFLLEKTIDSSKIQLRRKKYIF
ncbi:MAG: hypothetical protein JW982_03360 [Spirochaetes bacterium]|nr:hypothetical protein [Spirochaetota bacterium]